MSTTTAKITDARLVDGTTIGVRPVDPEDREALRDLLEGLSAHARFLRFLQPIPAIPDWAVDSLCRRDDTAHIARIATTDDDRVVGIAQCFVHPTAADTAEVAVTIATPFQRRGLGQVLLHALAMEARVHGIDTFTYLASPGNRPAVRLMRNLGATSHFSDGLITGLVPVEVLRRRAARRDSPRQHAPIT